MRTPSFLILSLLPLTLIAQPAALEIKGVFGECIPVYASTSSNLQLYKLPDLRSDQIDIPYWERWRIPAPKSEGLTRILEIGALRVTTPDANMSCSVAPTTGSAVLIQGEIVEYLYYHSEGFGEIRVRGGQCQAEVAESLGHFELVRPPYVQIWFKVFFEDGSSPGWLLHDGTQMRVVDVRC